MSFFHGGGGGGASPVNWTDMFSIVMKCCGVTRYTNVYCGNF